MKTIEFELEVEYPNGEIKLFEELPATEEICCGDQECPCDQDCPGVQLVIDVEALDEHQRKALEAHDEATAHVGWREDFHSDI